MPPIRFPVALCAILSLAACGGGNPFAPIDEEPDDGGGGGGGTSGLTVPAGLAGNVQSFAYDSDDQTLSVVIASLDSTPSTVAYERRTDLDRPGFLAFGVQEDALDRFFVAMVGESADGAVQATAVSDGGQFNRVFNGGSYNRVGGFDAPEIGDGPAAGQVSYAGSYTGLVNGAGSGGLIPTDPDTPTVLEPGQPAQITGDAFMNANFADMTVNGAVYNRVLRIGGGFDLDDIVLVPTGIDANGQFEGAVEFDDETNIGSYGGIFGGEDAASVAGLIALTQFSDLFENELEQGVFILTQCNQPDAPPICDQVAR